MAWFLVYIHNLRVPLLAVATLGILLCVVIGWWGSRTRGLHKSGTADYDAAVWRQLTCLKVGVTLSVLCAFVWAIPAPDYDVRYVDRPVTVEVVKWRNIYRGTRDVFNSYKDLYESCTKKMGEVVDEGEAQLCHKQAMEASRPGPKFIRQTKYVKVHDSYKELFDNCNSNSLDDAPKNLFGQWRNERLAICHKAALEGSRDR